MTTDTVVPIPRHCWGCGSGFSPEAPWPRRCDACAEFTYLNPLPVAVVLLPVDDGLLVVRRGIQPGRGELALPGGFIELGESWREAGARELQEETSIEVSPEELTAVQVASTRIGTLLVFGLARPRRSQDLPDFSPDEETLERVVLDVPQELAFWFHTTITERFFATRRDGGLPALGMEPAAGLPE